MRAGRCRQRVVPAPGLALLGVTLLAVGALLELAARARGRALGTRAGSFTPPAPSTAGGVRSRRSAGRLPTASCRSRAGRSCRSRRRHHLRLPVVVGARRDLVRLARVGIHLVLRAKNRVGPFVGQLVVDGLPVPVRLADAVGDLAPPCPVKVTDAVAPWPALPAPCTAPTVACGKRAASDDGVSRTHLSAVTDDEARNGRTTTVA